MRAPPPSVRPSRLTTIAITAILIVPGVFVLTGIGRQLLAERMPESTAAYPFFIVLSVLGLIAGGVLLRAIWRRARIL